MAGLPFRFTVLNSPIVNAFTIGGGHVDVARGILAAMNTEAELAALLAHEVAHVT
jgi:predicted Zn-dependent protease